MVTVTAVIMLCVICTTCVVSNEPMRVAVNSKIDQRCTQDTTPVCSTIENALEKCAELLNNTSTDCWVELIEEDVGGHGFMSSDLALDQSYNVTISIMGVAISKTRINVIGGYFIHTSNFMSLTLSDIVVENSSDTAIIFTNNNPGSLVGFDQVTLNNCSSDKPGAPGALWIQSAGLLMINVLTNLSYASSDCTAIRLDVFPTTIIFTEPDFDPQSFAHSFLLTDGTMCVFASEYSILNVGVVSCTITQQTEMQHCLWIRGPGEFSLVSYSVQSAASALLAEEFTNLTILGLTYIDNIFATGVRNHLLTIRYGTSVSIANLEIKGYTNFTPDNGACLVIEQVDHVEIRNSKFENCLSHGYGAGILLNNTSSLIIENTVFVACRAKEGVSITCAEGSQSVSTKNVSFSGNTNTVPTHSDIYSDGSCSSPFWYSWSECPTPSCDSCPHPGESCGIDAVNVCACYSSEYSDSTSGNVVMSKVSQPTTTTQESENSIPVTVDITFSFLDMFVLVGVLIFVCVVILSVSCIVANFIRSVNKRGSIPISVQVEMDQLVEDSSNSF